MPSDPNCDPFKTLKLICNGPMGMMANCTHYTNLCKNTSVVRECSIATLPVPAANTLLVDIKEICKMPMEGCKLCGNTSGTCDTLTVYSELCQAMSTMVSCGAWHTLCTNVPSWSICGGTPGSMIPSMQMFFHWSLYDYVLFKTWVPQDSTQYAFALLGIFFFAILYEGLKAGRAVLEFKWRVQRQPQKIDVQRLVQSPSEEFLAPFDFIVDSSRSLLRGAELVVSYFMMLIAMTFNGGFFIAIILGGIIGTFIFGRFQHPIGTTIQSVDEDSCH